MQLYVGNLYFGTTENSLRELFSQFGDISSLKIIKDQDTGRSKGFGFIEMAMSEDAANAIADLNGQDFEGRQIKVNEASQKSNSRRY